MCQISRGWFAVSYATCLPCDVIQSRARPDNNWHLTQGTRRFTCVTGGGRLRAKATAVHLKWTQTNPWYLPMCYPTAKRDLAQHVDWRWCCYSFLTSVPNVVSSALHVRLWNQLSTSETTPVNQNCWHVTSYEDLFSQKTSKVCRLRTGGFKRLAFTCGVFFLFFLHKFTNESSSNPINTPRVQEKNKKRKENAFIYLNAAFRGIFPVNIRTSKPDGQQTPSICDEWLMVAKRGRKKSCRKPVYPLSFWISFFLQVLNMIADCRDLGILHTTHATLDDVRKYSATNTRSE